MSIPSSALSSTGTAQSLHHQRKADLKTMASDVQSGDLSGAQSALSALQQLSSGTQANGAQQPSQLQTDFANLISSIQSGSTNGAQTALGALQSSTQTQAVGSSAAAGSTRSSFSQDLASLIQAVQSGSLSGAQQDVTQLQSDMKNSAGAHHHHHHAAAATDSTNATNTIGGNTAGTSASAYTAMMNLQPSDLLVSTQA